MTKASGSLQDLRRGIYVKAKAEPFWRFWGLYVHVCKMETLQAAYAMAKKNNGAPGIDGVTFEDIEARGAQEYIEQIRNELTEPTYVPLRARKKMKYRRTPTTAGSPCAASWSDKSRRSTAVNVSACSRHCPARRSWRPARDPVRDSAALRSTRRQSPCPKLLAGHGFGCSAGSPGIDAGVRPRTAPAMYLPSSRTSFMHPIEVSGGS